MHSSSWQYSTLFTGLASARTDGTPAAQARDSESRDANSDRAQIRPTGRNLKVEEPDLSRPCTDSLADRDTVTVTIPGPCRAFRIRGLPAQPGPGVRGTLTTSRAGACDPGGLPVEGPVPRTRQAPPWQAPRRRNRVRFPGSRVR